MISLTTFREDAGDITADPTGRTDGDTTTWSYDEATGLLVQKPTRTERMKTPPTMP